jgi:hypothetical protein
LVQIISGKSIGKFSGSFLAFAKVNFIFDEGLNFHGFSGRCKLDELENFPLKNLNYLNPFKLSQVFFWKLVILSKTLIISSCKLTPCPALLSDDSN